MAGRASRQGEPGSAQRYSASGTIFLRRFALALLRRPALAGPVCRFAQFRAQRQAFHARRGVLDRDTWLDESLSFAGRE